MVVRWWEAEHRGRRWPLARIRRCAGEGGVQESVCRCLVTAQETRRRLTEPPRQHTVTTIPAQDADFNWSQQSDSLLPEDIGRTLHCVKPLKGTFNKEKALAWAFCEYCATSWCLWRGWSWGLCWGVAEVTVAREAGPAGGGGGGLVVAPL